MLFNEKFRKGLSTQGDQFTSSVSEQLFKVHVDKSAPSSSFLLSPGKCTQTNSTNFFVSVTRGGSFWPTHHTLWFPAQGPPALCTAGCGVGKCEPFPVSPGQPALALSCRPVTETILVLESQADFKMSCYLSLEKLVKGVLLPQCESDC